MRRFATNAVRRKLSLLFAMAVLLVGVGPLLAPSNVWAAQPVPRSLTMSDNGAGAPDVDYRLEFTIATPGIVGSIELQFCDNSAIDGDPCNPPAGFNAANVHLGPSGGMTGFIVSPATDANTIILSRPPAATGQVSSFYEFSKIANPTNNGPMYARIQTFPTSDASGPATDFGGLALYITPGISLHAEVPPYLTFCLGETITNFDCSTATEAFSDLGDLSSAFTSAAQTQAVVATNAQNGYTMWAQGTTMTSGNNVIPAMSGGTAQKGVAQFGLNLRANNTPHVGQDPTGPGTGTPAAAYGEQDHYRFQSGDVLASATTADDFRKYTMSYVVDVAPDQPGGVYSTTLTYVCLANF